MLCTCSNAAAGVAKIHLTQTQAPSLRILYVHDGDCSIPIELSESVDCMLERLFVVNFQGNPHNLISPHPSSQPHALRHLVTTFGDLAQCESLGQRYPLLKELTLIWSTFSRETWTKSIRLLEDLTKKSSFPGLCRIVFFGSPDKSTGQSSASPTVPDGPLPVYVQWRNAMHNLKEACRKNDVEFYDNQLCESYVFG